VGGGSEERGVREVKEEWEGCVDGAWKEVEKIEREEEERRRDGMGRGGEVW
jgi:hypothetical protein